MASVFLSYAREDAQIAKALATALERAGHQVWWDRHIRGGSQFSGAIEKALRDADLVLVLWSKTSVDSPWVRDEASEGRDSDRLIPILIDGIRPPIGFRQFQSIDFSGWKGRGSPKRFPDLLNAISDKSQEAPVQPARDLQSAAVVQPKSANAWYIKLIGAALIIAVVAAAIFMTSFAKRDEITLAVLPFADLSPGRDNAYFAEGVAEEILSTLSAEPAIKVLGRTSARQLDRQPDPADVRARLGVTHLLEGSARTAGNQLRVNVRLIDTADGAQLWEEEYQGKLADIFSVQDRIAQTVLVRLRGTLLQEAVRGTEETTVDAYQAYLAARALMRTRSEKTLKQALVLARQALSTDPNFAAGHALYAELLHHLSDHPLAYGDIPVAQAHALARPHALKSIQLAPQSADGHAALGLISKPQQSLEPLRRAIQLDPSRAELRIWLEISLSQLGRYDEAFGQIRSAVEIEPLWAVTVNRLVLAHAASLRFNDALAAIARFERMGGSKAQAARFRASTARRMGDHATSSAYSELALKLDPTLPYVASQLAGDYHLLGLTGRAAAAVPADSEGLRRLLFTGKRDLIRVHVERAGADLWNSPDLDAAIFALSSARDWSTLARLYRQKRDSAQNICRELKGNSLPFATALSVNGDVAEARSLRACVQRQLSSTFSQSWRSGDMFAAEPEMDQARLFAATGQKDQAIRWLHRAIDRGWRGYPYSADLRDWPDFDPLRSDPRLRAAQQRIDRTVSEQRARVLGRR